MIFKVSIFTLILGIKYCRGVAENVPPEGDTNSQASQFERFEKNYFPKDVSEGTNARAIMSMWKELTSLEENVKYLNDGVESIKSKTDEIEATALRQEAILKHLGKSFEGVEKTLFSHTDMMDELLEIIGPNDKIFSVSNNSCGDILSGQSGYISLTDTLSKPSGNVAYNCVWTIQAGHHSFIKFNIQTVTLSSIVKVYLVELANDQVNQSQLTTIVRELHQGLLYQVKGPLAFVVLSIANISFPYNVDIKPTIQIRYEGTGRLSQRKTQFNHKFLNIYENLTSFTQNDLKCWKNQSDESNEETEIVPIKDFTYESEQNVVVLNKLATRALVKFHLDKTTCQNSSFWIISDLLANGTSLTDYCESNPSNWTGEKLIFGTPIVFLIKTPIQNKLLFNISWRAEQTNSGNRNETSTSCTEQLGGTSGSLSFSGSQSSSARCISIRLAALNQPWSGDIHGIRGADYSCYRQARSANLQGTFRAFLTSWVQNLTSIVKSSNLNLPVVNTKGDLLFSSWTEVFQNSGKFVTRPPPIYSFDGRNVFQDFHWPQKMIWHGADATGAKESNCDAWNTDAVFSVGLASDFIKGELIGQEKISCNHKLIVLCVEIPSQNHHRRKRDVHEVNQRERVAEEAHSPTSTSFPVNISKYSGRMHNLTFEEYAQVIDDYDLIHNLENKEKSSN